MIDAFDDEYVSLINDDDYRYCELSREPRGRIGVSVGQWGDSYTYRLTTREARQLAHKLLEWAEKD